MEIRSEILRVMKSHAKKCVIYIDVPEKVLIERGSKEGEELQSHKARYENVIKSFNTFNIEPREIDDYFITDELVDVAYKFIKKQMK
ncbi:MAG: hypothetical protein ACKPBV_16920 [Sphaerospermopsis kisseleviana]